MSLPSSRRYRASHSSFFNGVSPCTVGSFCMASVMNSCKVFLWSFFFDPAIPIASFRRVLSLLLKLKCLLETVSKKTMIRRWDDGKATQEEKAKRRRCWLAGWLRLAAWLAAALCRKKSGTKKKTKKKNTTTTLNTSQELVEHAHNSLVPSFFSKRSWWDTIMVVPHCTVWLYSVVGLVLTLFVESFLFVSL